MDINGLGFWLVKRMLIGIPSGSLCGGEIELENRAYRKTCHKQMQIFLSIKMSPIIARWKLVKNLYCFVDNRRYQKKDQVMRSQSVLRDYIQLQHFS